MPLRRYCVRGTTRLFRVVTNGHISRRGGIGPEPAAQTKKMVDPHASSARESCGKRVFVALALCMDERCEDPRWRNSEECIPILARKRQRAGG